MNLRIAFISGFTLIMILFSGFAAGEENKVNRASWEDLRILSERNIFSRNRVKTVIPVNIEIQDEQRVEVKEENYLVLRGITQQANRFVAFIEDNRTMEVKKVLKDGMIGNGKIGDITLDHITYVLEGKPATVKVGMSLSGVAGGMDSGYPSGFGTPGRQSFISIPSNSEEDTPQVKVTDESAKDILQRLKERRKKELGE